MMAAAFLGMAGLKMAVKALAQHRLRSVLAILGIFLGTLVLTGVTHIGSSMIAQADAETQKLGPNLVQVRAGRIRFMRADTTADTGTAARVATGAISTVTEADAKAVYAAVPQVGRLAMYIASGKPIRAGAIKSDSQVLGVSPEYSVVRSLELLDGRFISRANDEGLALVAVLGHTIAGRLFGSASVERNEVVGQAVFIGEARLTVIGVLAAKGADLGGASFDEQVFVPLRTYMRRLVNTDRISGFYVNLHEGSSTAQAKGAITEILRERHKIGPGKRDDFLVYSSDDAARLRNETLELVRSLGVLSAGISFGVGGLGIFSIMILLVRSRKQEIGIRRAVGASRKVIIRQFLTESGLMAGTGGVLGVALGLGLVTLIYRYTGMPYVYEPLFCLLAASASVLAGVLAGAWPAWQASRVEVLTALKSWN
ncbi:MAG: ABC transporter permease [Deltaproteobacteria bacterium]|jgi:putative ABC transport system permease protein|nr:ABC transporter permease [Deltaproteobacteria bacterium]